MTVAEQLYFPTPIYTGRLDAGPGANQRLLELIYQERDRDRVGIGRSTYRATQGWHSRVDLHEEDAYRDLVATIQGELAQVSESSGYDRGYELSITSMWAIINGPGGSNRAHIHPKCTWSGVYYVQAPDDCGNIEFVDPRTVHVMTQPRYIPKRRRKRSRWTKVTYTPQAGKLMIFPSWLYHSVAPNATDETGCGADRVIISFNANQQKVR